MRAKADTTEPAPDAGVIVSGIATGTAAARFEAELPLELIIESPHNPRQRFPEASMAELTESIREKGVVTPLLVRQNGKGYEIAAGHRRRRAAIAAGRETVPALIRTMTDPEFLELLVLENDHREDVHPLEEARGYQALMKLPGYDVAKIAARVGRSPKYVYDRLKLLELIPEAQKLFLEDRFAAGHAILLARLSREDQKRLLSVSKDGFPTEPGGLFQRQGHGLPFNQQGKTDSGADAGGHDAVKATSVRELAGWIQRNVRVEASAIDPFLFPETMEVLEAAKGDKLKVVLITREYLASDDVRHAGKERVFGENAWKRADGQEKSKTCDHSRVGLVASGPGQNEAFRVCLNKEKCSTHWSAWQKDRKKARAAGGSEAVTKQQERWKQEEQKRRLAQEAREAERERWDKARPTVLEAVAAAVRKTQMKATGFLATIVAEEIIDSRASRSRDYAGLDRGKSLEDLVRYLAWVILVREACEWDAPQQFPARAKAFGIDARAIVDQVAPKEVQTSAEPKPAKKGRR
jgi:ParB/RepB/Spo0J family partition protein